MTEISPVRGAPWVLFVPHLAAGVLVDVVEEAVEVAVASEVEVAGASVMEVAGASEVEVAGASVGDVVVSGVIWV